MPAKSKSTKTSDDSHVFSLNTQEEGKNKNKKGSISKNEKIAIIVSVVVLIVCFFAAAFLIRTKGIGQKETVTTNVQAPIEKPLFLSDLSPLDGTISNTQLVEVQGLTLPNTVVVFYSDFDQGTVESDSQGVFKGTINLTDGINLITVTAYSDKGEEKSQEIYIVYDDQVKGVKSDKQTGKPEKTEKIPFGKLKKVSSQEITFTDEEGQESFVIGSDTKIVGQDKKELRASLLKLDDLVAVVSTESAQLSTSEADLQKAKKIYIKDANYQKKRNAVQGVITQIAGNQITLVHQTQSERSYSVTVDESTIYKVKGMETAALGDLLTGFRIVAIGDSDATTILAKMIHVIPGKSSGLMNRFDYSTTTQSAQLTITPVATESPTPSIEPELTTTPTATPSVTITTTPTE